LAAAILICLAFLLGTSSAMALTNISAPGTLSKSGETYVLTADITASGTAFSITANGITLDGQGHTVVYATGGSGNAVYMDNRGSVTVKNLVIDLPANSSASGTAAAVRAGSCTGCVVDNCTINLDKGTASGNTALSFAYGVGDTVSNCNLTVRPVAYGVDLQQNNGARVFGNTILMRANYVNSYAICINASCSGPSAPGGTQIYNNNITVEGGSGTYKGIGIGVGMNFRNGQIYGNTISDASEQARALMLDSGAYNNIVHDNVISTTGGSCRGIRLRDSSNNEFYNNTVNTTGGGGTPLEVGRADSTFSGVAYNVIHDNHFRAEGANTPAVLLYEDSEHNAFYGNEYVSNYRSLSINDSSDNTFTRDTFRAGSSPSGYVSVNIGASSGYTWSHPATGNILTDPMSAGPLSYAWGGGTWDLTVRFTATITVTGPQGTGVEGATVSITDATGANAYTGTSDANGQVVVPLVYFVQSSPSSRVTKTPHTIRVSKAGFADQQASVTADHVQTVTIPLSGDQPVLSMAADNLTPKPGQTVTYTITYANQSAEQITNCVVKTTVPAHTTFVADSAGSGIYDSQTGVITWSIGTLTPGQQGQVSYQAKID